MLLTLSVLLTIAITACGGSRSSFPDNPPEGTYLPDPLFEQFYEKNGGFEFFGFGISTLFSDQTGQKFQYFETVLMVYDPIQDRIYFEDIGSQLGLGNLPIPSWSGGSLDDSPLVGEYFIHPAFVSLYFRLGPELVGKPITQPFANLNRNHVEQHFQNLGLYFMLDDPEETVGLLEYGRLDCGGCQPQYYPGDDTGIIQAPLTDKWFYQQMDDKEIYVPLTGEVVRGPALLVDGATDLVFKHMVLVKENGELKIRPLPVLLGLQDEFLYNPLVQDGMIFYEYQNGVGHNVYYVFDEYVRSNGGYQVSGQPITEIILIDQATTQIRQCFENYCLDYFPNMAVANVRPTPLGELYLERIAPQYVAPSEPVNSSDEEYSTKPRNKSPFTLIGWENHTVVNSSTPQTIFVLVSLQNTPQPNKELVLKITYPDGAETTIKMPATGEDGLTGVTLEPIVGQNGELVIYEACLYIQNADPACVQQSFLIWGNP
jgi:hypothetical protein